MKSQEKEYRNYKITNKGPVSQMIEEVPSVPVYVLMNFKGELMSSSLFPTAIFRDKDLAESRFKEWQDSNNKDVYIEEGFQCDDQLRLPPDGDLTLPATQPQKGIAQMILYAALETMGETPHTGGCRTFFTPDEWRERKEQSGTDEACQLIICHDGGDFSSLCSYDKGAYGMMDRFSELLDKEGYYIEQGSCWYSCVYKKEDDR